MDLPDFIAFSLDKDRAVRAEISAKRRIGAIQTNAGRVAVIRVHYQEASLGGLPDLRDQAPEARFQQPNAKYGFLPYRLAQIKRSVEIWQADDQDHQELPFDRIYSHPQSRRYANQYH